MGADHDELMALLYTVPGVKEHVEECRKERKLAILAHANEACDRNDEALRKLGDGSVRWQDIQRE